MPDPRQLLRVKRLSYTFAVVAAVALIWLWYLLEHFTAWRLHDYGPDSPHPGVPVLVPLISSVVLPLIAFTIYQRARSIVAHGVQVAAIVESVGLGSHTMRNVTFRYVFNGVSYSKRKSISADNLHPGDSLSIVVDQRHPNRILVDD